MLTERRRLPVKPSTRSRRARDNQSPPAGALRLRDDDHTPCGALRLRRGLIIASAIDLGKPSRPGPLATVRVRDRSLDGRDVCHPAACSSGLTKLL